MKYEVFSVYDEKANYYHTPFYARNSEEAKRMFGTACRDKQTLLGNNPEDFTLYGIGFFNDSNGMFESFVENKWVCRAIEFVNKEVKGNGYKDIQDQVSV